jgi:peptide/nickel transport system permease protein
VASYVARRLLVTVLLVWAIASLVFLVLRLAPGDVVQVLLAEGGASPDLIESRRRALGLDLPMHVQYGRWLTQVLRLDLGTSLATQRRIGPDIATALPRSLELVASALVFSLLVGVPAGILAATRRGQRSDLLVSFASMGGLSVPNFVSGTLLLLCFGLWLRWFPTAGYVSLGENPVMHLRFLVLPTLTLGLTLAAITARFTRSAMLEVLGQDYVRTAHAKGLAPTYVRLHHAFRNAIIPVVTIIGVESGSLLGGTVVVEYVFNWPGMSTLLIQGASRRDYPMVEAVVLVVATLFLVLNLCVDVINAYIDPRIHYA